MLTRRECVQSMGALAGASGALACPAPLSNGKEHAVLMLNAACGNPDTLADLAAAISKQSGRDIPYVNMPTAEYTAALIQAGLPEEMAGFLAHCDEEAAKGALFDDTRALSKLIGRPTTSLEAAVTTALA